MRTHFLRGAWTTFHHLRKCLTGTRAPLAAILATATAPAFAIDMTWTEGDFSSKGFPIYLGAYPWTGLELIGPGNKRLDRSIENGGEINLRGGSLDITDGTVLTNYQTLRVFETAGISTASAGTINNTGRIIWAVSQRPYGSDQVDHWQLAGVSLINSGTLSTDGVVEYTGGGTLTFNEGTSFQTDYSVLGQRPGIHKINKNGIVMFNISSTGFGYGDVELANGTFIAAHERGLTLHQNFVWSGGEMRGDWNNLRTFKMAGAGQKVLGEGSHFQSSERVDLTDGYLLIKSRALFVSDPFRTDNSTDRGMFLHNDADIGVEELAGFGIGSGGLYKVSGLGDSTISVAGNVGFSTFGLVETELRADSGRINIVGSGEVTLFDIVIGGAGTVRVAPDGNVRVHYGLRVKNSALEIGGGTWSAFPRIGSEELVVQGDLRWTGGTLVGHWVVPEGSTWYVSGDATRRIEGVLENRGTIIASGPVRLVSQSFSWGERIVNAGVMRFESDYVFPFGGSGVRTENRPGARIEIASGPVFLRLSGPRKVEGSPVDFEYPENRGTIVVSTGGELLLNPDSHWDNFGEIVTERGTRINLGNITNYGRIALEGSFFGWIKNEGELSVGAETDDDPFLSGSVDLSSAGTLILNVESADSFDSLSVGNVSTIEAPQLRGTLILRNAGYQPVAGESISVLSNRYERIHGQFSEVFFEGFDPALRFEMRYGEHAVTVDVLAVPEPVTWWMFGAGGGLCAAMERRRRRRFAKQ